MDGSSTEGVLGWIDRYSIGVWVDRVENLPFTPRSTTLLAKHAICRLAEMVDR